MAGITPIPTTRVGDMFVRQRLASQAQRDQLDLFRLQHQLATGQRLQLPSDDAPAALRAINLQRLIDRKGQIQSNILASTQYLSGADARLRTVADDITELRGEVVGVTGNVVPEDARLAVAQNVDALIKELVNAGNAQLQGRYLFAGSKSPQQPYNFDGLFVEYSGNEGKLRSYVDLEQLFETNLAGTDVFGGISAAHEGKVDLQPQLTIDTLVRSLNGGNGIGSNATIQISHDNGTSTVSRTVDLSGAVTVTDLAKLIEAGAPDSADLTVEITGEGLVLRAASGTITVSEVGEGQAARLLGIRSDPYALPSATITGDDLNPALLKTTKLSDILGTKTSGVLVSPDINDDIVITAANNGAAFNGVNVNFVSGAPVGLESATYDSNTNTLTIMIEPSVSTANQVVDAINAEGTFTARIDYHDATSAIQAGTKPVGLASFTNVTSGGSGEILDTDSGLHLTNAGQSVTLDVSGANTVEDLLNQINGASIGLLAEINADASGINVRSRISGANFMIGENGGTTATQLGLRTMTGETELAALNRGQGVPTTSTLESIDASKLDQLEIVARNGTTLTVNLAGATTLQDVVTLVNNAVGNNAGGTAVLARTAGGGNRLELVDSSTPANARLQVNVPLGTEAAEYLGLVPDGATQYSSTEFDTSGNDVIGGDKLLGNDFVIVARSGIELSVDLAGATTVQEVIDRINSNPDNVPPIITAQLARVGNGIELIDSSVGAGTLTVRASDGSLAARALGFVAEGVSQSDPASVQIEGANQVLQSEDRYTLETDSVFNTLIRLRTALTNGDSEEIGRALERLDVDISRMTFARAEIGGRLQNLEVIETRLQDENVELQSALSQDMDVDLIEAISQLTARQYSFEASLRSAGSLMQLSLLNFL